MIDDVFDMPDHVVNRKDFVEFVRKLRRDFLENGNEWENNTLDRFLDGLAAFTESIGGYYKNMHENVDPDQITWRMAAQILSAGPLYE